MVYVGKASTKAQNKYISKAYDRINLVVPKGDKERIKQHAESKGESVNGFIGRAISETMERDNQSDSEQEDKRIAEQE